MKSSVTTLSLLLLLVFAADAIAADRPATRHGAVPTTTLTDLGLAGLQPLSDRDGLQVRGRSAVHVPNGVPGRARDLISYVPPPNNALVTPGNGTPVLGVLGNGTANGVLVRLFGVAAP